MRHAAFAWGLTLMLAAPGGAAPLATRTFTKPCEQGAPRLKLTLGPLARGVEIEVRTEDGTLIGTAAPFALRDGAAAGTYQLSLPRDLFRGDQIVLRLAARQYGVPDRTPTADEVKDAAVLCVPAPQQR